MAQLLISRELYSETPHEAHVAAHHQAVTWDESQALGLTQDYYPTVDMECADLYIGGEANMLEELLECVLRSQPFFIPSIMLIVKEDEDIERFERFLDQGWLGFEEE